MTASEICAETRSRSERLVHAKLEPGSLVITEMDLTECQHPPMLIIHAYMLDSRVVHVTAVDEETLHDGEWSVESVRHQIERVL